MCSPALKCMEAYRCVVGNERRRAIFTANLHNPHRVLHGYNANIPYTEVGNNGRMDSPMLVRLYTTRIHTWFAEPLQESYCSMDLDFYI